MKTINLLPKIDQKELRLQFFATQLAVFWFWVIVSLFFFVTLTFTVKAYLSVQLSETEGQISLDKDILRSSDNELLKKQVENLNTQLGVIKNLQSEHYYWSRALIELSNILPVDITLDRLTMNRQDRKVEIRGNAKTRESVLQFWANVHKSDYFYNIDFPLANLQKAIDDPFYFSFYINPQQ